MNPITNCRTCGRTIPADAPQGICPSCVFGLVGKSNRTTDAGHAPTAEAPRLADVARAFPQLEILESIGHGGMGAVYRVRQIALDRIAALKLLNIRLANDPLFQERFAREAKLMARLLHPNIATIFEFGQSGHFCFLLMEFIDGVNLREAIRTKSSTPEEALRIIPQICDALQYAHDQGVIHRDVKPENILLDKYGRVKLVDFGLAKLNASSPGQMSLTGTQQIMGTMNYMAPEQREHSHVVDHRADIYSLGVVFYELLTGELPLGKFSEPSLRAKSNQRLDPVVMRTLEKDPDARYQSASEVKTAVDAASHVDHVSENRLREWKTSPLDEPALPFQVGDNIQHWQTFGLAHLTARGLLLEYHRKHKWWGHDQGIGKVLLPFDEIASIRLKNGPVTKGIEIKTRSLESLADFPSKTERGILLRTKSEDDDVRRKLSDRVCSTIGQLPSTGLTERQLQTVDSRLRGPTWCLGLTAVVNLLGSLVCFSVLGFLLWYIFLAPLQPETGVSRSASEAVGEASGSFDSRGTKTTVTTSPWRPLTQSVSKNRMFLRYQDSVIGLVILSPLAAIVGLLQLFARSRIRNRKDYWTGMAGFISALVPLHPGWIIGLPTGIWGLAVMGTETSYLAFDAQDQPEKPPKPSL